MNFNVLNNFISPVTGRILCDTNHVLVGDVNGIAIPSIIIPIGSLPDLAEGNIWIGDAMNRPQPNPIITIDNLPNLTSGKIWIGSGGNPSRPIEGNPPKGPKGDKGDDGSRGSSGSGRGGGDGGSFLGSIIGGAIGGGLALAGGYNGINSLLGPPGAAGTSGQSTLFLNTNLNMVGARIENIAQSPQADFDAVSAKFVWDLLNDNVEIIWET